MSGLRQSEPAHIAMAALALGTVTFGLRWLSVTNAATVSTTYLMVVLLVVTTARLRVAVGTSVAAMLSVNFFFLPPVGTFTIVDPHNWVALFAFLAVSLVASNLSAVARARTEEAESRRDELARLFDLSRDVLMMTDSQEALSVLARAIARRFDLDFVAIAVPREGDWRVHAAGKPSLQIDHREIASVMVCMSSNALAPRVIRTGARIAGRLGSKWYAVYVETPREQPGRINVRDADALLQNIRLAESLGATVVRVKASRPADGLVAFAQREGVTHVIFGQSARSRLEVLWRGSTLDRFLGAVPDAAVQVVPLTES